jgi:CheY-like chemotaxis protein
MSKRILVVDDEPDVCVGLEKVLNENGFAVDSYEDPVLAVENFKAGLYDLVILDIKMPELNGFELYRDIKRTTCDARCCYLFVRVVLDSQICQQGRSWENTEYAACARWKSRTNVSQTYQGSN